MLPKWRKVRFRIVIERAMGGDGDCVRGLRLLCVVTIGGAVRARKVATVSGFSDGVALSVISWLYSQRSTDLF